MRYTALLSVLLVWLPLSAAAQGPYDGMGRFSVTAFTGARVPFTTGSVVVYNAEGTPLFAAREQRGGNPILGLEGEVGIGRGFSAIVGGTYSRTGEGEFFLDREPGFGERGDFIVRYGSDTWFAKAGLSLKVTGENGVRDGRAMPSTHLIAAGAVVRQFEDNHPALNLGFRGSMPVLGRALEATIGVEDYFVFWDGDALGTAMLDLLGPVRTGSTDAEMFYDTSHLFVIRVGATLRM
jgi:hypothetical protein